MKLFQATRLKLTLWYLVIIMFISISFSTVVYQMQIFEINRVEQMQQRRLHRQENILDNNFRNFPPPPIIDPEVITEFENRLKLALLFINLGILVTSTAAGYFLAGKTLKPIQETFDEQDRFITDASHELRTPLTSLKTEIEVALRDKKMSINEARKLLMSNLEEVNNLQTLSDNLIQLGQVNNSQLKLEEAILPVSEIAAEAIQKISKKAKHKNIIIKSKFGNEYIKGYKPALVELLVIFLDNSVKYSPEKTTIDIASSKNNNYAIIKISDHGIGIDAKDLPHIFDRFYRSDQSRTKNKTQGYGLGLSIAQQIINRYHGKVLVKSELGKGSVFTIQLPKYSVNSQN